jgi:hypothetical protein
MEMWRSEGEAPGEDLRLTAVGDTPCSGSRKPEETEEKEAVTAAMTTNTVETADVTAGTTEGPGKIVRNPHHLIVDHTQTTAKGTRGAVFRQGNRLDVAAGGSGQGNEAEAADAQGGVVEMTGDPTTRLGMSPKSTKTLSWIGTSYGIWKMTGCRAATATEALPTSTRR